MTDTQFLQAAISLIVQVGLLTGLTTLLGRWASDERARSHLWMVYHVLVLLITVSAFVMPHYRWWNVMPVSAVDRTLLIRAIAIESRLGMAIQWLWVCGAGGIGFLLVTGWVQVARTLRQCRSLLPTEQALLDSSDWLEGSDDAARNVGNRSDFLVSTHLPSPICWQIQRPVIVIPEFMFQFPPTELGLIIRHERAHLQAGHPLALFLQRLVEMSHWYHPLVWWASFRAVLRRELACDAAAVRSRRETSDYLHSLLKAVEYSLLAKGMSPARLDFNQNRNLITQRVNRLVTQADCPPSGKHRPNGRLLAGTLSVVTVLIALLWCPLQLHVSQRADWTPWPKWTASVLNNFGLTVRDYEIDGRYDSLDELTETYIRPFEPQRN